MNLKQKRFWSYVLSFVISIFIIFSIAAIAQIIYEAVFKTETTAWNVALFIGACFGIVSSTVVYAKTIRTSLNPIAFISINLPNWFYDQEFENEVLISDKELIKENQEHEDYILELESVLDEYMDELRKKTEDLNFEAHISDIYIRHHKNASRLVRSLLSLISEKKDTWRWEFCNNILDECVTVLHLDKADKSSAIYFIDNDKLKMYAYNRLEFWSSRNRAFKEKEGFAGHVWTYGKTVLINDIQKSTFFSGEHKPMHEYGSILGIPIKIGDQVVGVLCVQSEKEDGFTQEDERSVKFYADISALAYYCDTIINNKEGDKNDND